MEVEYSPALKVLNEAKLGILSADWLARWEDYGTIDWINYLEYPEFTAKQMQQLLDL